MDYKYRFTVFTATYNRGHLLKKVYDDLCHQTFKDFEWVIVDDGSIDNTAKVCQSFMDNSPFPIIYKRKSRDISSGGGGKHTAWIVGTPLFRGQYVFCTDDDDIIVPNTLEIYDKNWKILESQPNYNEFATIRTRCVDADTKELIGPELDKPWFDTNWNFLLFKLNIRCEFDGCSKVEIFSKEAAVPKSFPYKEMCTNYGEMLRWCNVAKKYKIRILPDVTRLYVISNESLCHSKDNKPSKSMMYNNLSADIEIINKLRDVLFEYNRYDDYIKTIMKISINSSLLHEHPIKFIDHFIDKFIYLLLYFPSMLIKIIRN